MSPGQRHLRRDRVVRSQLHDRAECRRRLGGPAQFLERPSHPGQGADAKRRSTLVAEPWQRRLFSRLDGSGHQPELLDGTVEVLLGQGGLGKPEPGAWQRLAIGELAAELRQRLGGGVGPARAELGSDQIGQGEFGDVAAWVVGQVTFEGAMASAKRPASTCD